MKCCQNAAITWRYKISSDILTKFVRSQSLTRKSTASGAVPFLDATFHVLSGLPPAASNSLAIWVAMSPAAPKLQAIPERERNFDLRMQAHMASTQGGA